MRRPEIVVGAVGTLGMRGERTAQGLHQAADSGKSIFLEESYQQKTGVKTFRWEIPYPCILKLNECPEIPRPSASVNEPREAAAESMPHAGALEFKKNLA